ncbi:MAG: glycine cleavage system aminomethyltransferase GcvT [Actinomycetota bacterium]|nr:glycine cleavage system aminomethyltransferase GcvT [Actinomycetota bacterium]
MVSPAAPRLRFSPLDAAHRALGATMVPFAGWEMPLAYPTGTLDEHRTCRDSAVAFDVSHLGTVRVAGPRAFERVNAVLTNDLGRIGPGRAQYTHLLDESDASVLDDIIVWWVGEDRFDVMPNASNTARVLSAVGGEDVTATRAVVAVQGPDARRRVQAVVPEAAAVPRFGVREVEWRGSVLVVAGTGYTGEDGMEFAVPAAAAEAFWQAVLDAGVEPAGLGARDTLRLEAALPLHGHELGPGITPLQAGLGWVVAWEKGPFQGRAPLEEERRRGPHRRLAGLMAGGRKPPREGCSVMVEGSVAGIVTSGNFSPTLERGIALAFLPPGMEVGTNVEVDVRNRSLAASVAPLPFLAKRGK